MRGKDVLAKPEEVVRQLWIHRLLTIYKYPVSRLAVEYPITFGRDSSKRADIVVFDADRTTVPFLIVEVKEPKLKDGKEQLKSYCHATGAPLAVWSNGILRTIWHRKNPNYFGEIPALPTVTQSIHDVADQPWTIDVLVAKETERNAKREPEIVPRAQPMSFSCSAGIAFPVPAVQIPAARSARPTQGRPPLRRSPVGLVLDRPSTVLGLSEVWAIIGFALS